jgi:hypothetical protein
MHTSELALLALEVEGCDVCGEGDGHRENTSLSKNRSSSLDVRIF